MGTSQDSESPESRERGCWDGRTALSGLISTSSSPASPNPEAWMIPPEFVDEFGNSCLPVSNSKVFDDKRQEYWKETIKKVYRGDQARRNARMCAISLTDRESLHARLEDIHCPVIWLHVRSHQSCPSYGFIRNLTGYGRPDLQCETRPSRDQTLYQLPTRGS